MMQFIRSFTISIVRAAEPTRAVDEVGEAAGSLGAQALVWDVNSGVRPYSEWASRSTRNPSGSDPLVALRALNEASGSTVMIALHFHHFLKSPQVQQAILDGSRVWGQTRRRLVMIAPLGATAPLEIERYVHVVDHPLPSPEELAFSARATAQVNNISITDEEALALGRLGKGLTRYEFSMAIAASLAQRGAFDRQTIIEQKRQLVARNPALEIVAPDFAFGDIGGLERAKRFLRGVCGHPLARGSLFLGVPGVGKTMLAKALSVEMGLPCLQLQFSRIFGSMVGESESRLRAALSVIDAMGQSIVVIDEIEKGLSGVSSSHKSDAGTAARVGEAFLTWMNDRPAGAYVVATCNDIERLPPEFVRAERWDAVFFFDLPTEDERVAIADLYARRYRVARDPRPDVDGWTGAEIATAYRLAAIMGVSAVEAGKYVIPLAETMSDQIARLREWARGRCVPASEDNRPDGGNANMVAQAW